MKKQMFLVGLLTVVSVTLASQSVMGFLASATSSVFEWESTSHDFGTLEQNKPAEHRFTFINEGNEPLIISSAKASCGCTVADYSREPIAPGEKGFVSASYDAAKIGAFTKTVTVAANTGTDAVVLTLKGEVVAAE